MKKIIFLFFTFSLLMPLAFADVHISMFYGNGCPHCSRLHNFLQDMDTKYDIDVTEYEVYSNNENRQLLQKFADNFETEISGVPMLFIDDKVIVGFSDSIGRTIENEIIRCSKKDCGRPIDKVRSSETTEITGDRSPAESAQTTEIKESLTISAVLTAAAVDAINPCAFAVLILLLTTILATDNKRRALFAGLAFTLSIFISYLLMGLGLYSAIQVTGLSHTFYIVVAILAILVGVFNMKDYFAYGKWFIMEVPISWRPKMKALLRGITSVPGAFMIGFVISLFLLPCTSGPYIVILGLLAHATTFTYALTLLVLYNFVFVIPMLVITLLIYFGITTTKQAEEWRSGKLKVLHLIAGILMLVVGIAMLVSVYLGLI